MLQVLIKSTDAQLTTTEAVKRVLGTTALTSDDGYISDLITRASAWAEAYLGYPLSAQKYRETLSGYGGRRLMLGRTPVRAVTGLWDTTDTGAATTLLSSEFRVDTAAGFVDRSAGFASNAPAFPVGSVLPSMSSGLAPVPWGGQESEPWLCDYIAGYSLDGLTTASVVWSTEKGSTSTERTLPHDIEDAIITKVVGWYEGMDDVLEKQVGDLRIKYGSLGSPNQPIVKDHAAMRLEPYRRWA